MTRPSTLGQPAGRAPRAGDELASPGERLAQVIPFRARPAAPVPQVITWHEAHRFERGARYREIAGGRTGYFIGASEVAALTAVGLSVLVLLFRDPETGVMWIYTEAEAADGVAYEHISWDTP